MNYRYVAESDLDLLAEWNRQLIRDEGHRNPMSADRLRERMKGWLEGDYTAVLFYSEAEPLAYALFSEDEAEIYLRQLFVRQGHRRQGIGRRAVAILREQIWPADKRLTVKVLTANEAAIAFWRSVGYTDYSLTLEIMPGEISEREHWPEQGTPPAAPGINHFSE